MDSFVEDQVFDKVNFTESPLAKGTYEHCRFLHCDLSSVNLSLSVFVDCVFTRCNLSMAAVSATVFRDVVFRECKMLGLRFDQAAANGVSCRFEGCVLEKADLRTAFNFAIDPERNRVKKARFSEAGLRGLLGKYGIEVA